MGDLHRCSQTFRVLSVVGDCRSRQSQLAVVSGCCVVFASSLEFNLDVNFELHELALPAEAILPLNIWVTETLPFTPIQSNIPYN
jgi:hypothetical protein